ncbi:hypothetical protein CXG81DRAFT_25452 [Caulochytrium protostelioides]|uniref:Uncharacterized protein n=1 Tax=Caulochytrium protostelioides TaxID=1555241 RepID=A0A4P9X9B3_9FUNG|nr:hypothetical protein CXG81DRAFT_25452 [Caulochytrium protostelioides]|eukprot:RKP01888.1 hypothetical protein CXG81DRAFT_25452 [Caulochytrium protostelioides]
MAGHTGTDRPRRPALLRRVSVVTSRLAQPVSGRPRSRSQSRAHDHDPLLKKGGQISEVDLTEALHAPSNAASPNVPFSASGLNSYYTLVSPQTGSAGVDVPETRRWPHSGGGGDRSDIEGDIDVVGEEDADDGEMVHTPSKKPRMSLLPPPVAMNTTAASGAAAMAPRRADPFQALAEPPPSERRLSDAMPGATPPQRLPSKLTEKRRQGVVEQAGETWVATKTTRPTSVSTITRPKAPKQTSASTITAPKVPRVAAAPAASADAPTTPASAVSETAPSTAASAMAMALDPAPPRASAGQDAVDRLQLLMNQIEAEEFAIPSVHKLQQLMDHMAADAEAAVDSPSVGASPLEPIRYGAARGHLPASGRPAEPGRSPAATTGAADRVDGTAARGADATSATATGNGRISQFFSVLAQRHQSLRPTSISTIHARWSRVARYSGSTSGGDGDDLCRQAQYRPDLSAMSRQITLTPRGSVMLPPMKRLAEAPSRGRREDGGDGVASSRASIMLSTTTTASAASTAPAAPVFLHPRVDTSMATSTMAAAAAPPTAGVVTGRSSGGRRSQLRPRDSRDGCTSRDVAAANPYALTIDVLSAAPFAAASSAPVLASARAPRSSDVDGAGSPSSVTTLRRRPHGPVPAHRRDTAATISQSDAAGAVRQHHQALRHVQQSLIEIRGMIAEMPSSLDGFADVLERILLTIKTARTLLTRLEEHASARFPLASATMDDPSEPMPARWQALLEVQDAVSALAIQGEAFFTGATQQRAMYHDPASASPRPGRSAFPGEDGETASPDDAMTGDSAELQYQWVLLNDVVELTLYRVSAMSAWITLNMPSA